MLKILLEVVLITSGVFLGLAGESWRETREHRELAAQSLRMFREEFKANRAAVLRVHQRHQNQAKGMIQVHWLRGLAGYFSDTALHEKLLLERYEKLLLRLDKAIGAAAAAASQ